MRVAKARDVKCSLWVAVRGQALGPGRLAQRFEQHDRALDRTHPAFGGAMRAVHAKRTALHNSSAPRPKVNSRGMQTYRTTWSCTRALHKDRSVHTQSHKRNVGIVIALLLSVFHTTTAVAQSEPDVGLITQALNVGVQVSGGCDGAQARAALEAWLYLALDLRNDPNLSANFQQCINRAMLVEVGCEDQLDRSRIIQAILTDSYSWQLECIDFPPRTDSAGNRLFTLADAHIGIDGASMRLDRTFLSTASKIDVAATMAHELMHNRGFTHSTHEFGSALYGLTVPEQAEVCVRSASGTPNAPPRADYWDRAECCYPAGQEFCDSRGCYKTFGYGCYPLSNDTYHADACGNFITRLDGTLIVVGDSNYPDADMCGYEVLGPFVQP